MRKAILLAGLASLAGCNFTPKYVQPVAPVAPTFPEATAGTRAATDIGWREFFGDPRLQAYLAAALANNRDLAQSVARVEQARAQYRITDADRLPQVEGVAGATRTRQPINALGFPIGGTNSGTGTGTPTPSSTPDAFTINQFSLGVQVPSYELDFWGRLRNTSEAARREYLATVEAERAFRISLVAQVAATYLQIRAGEEQIALAERTLAGRRDAVTIARKRMDAGVTSTVDFDQARLLVTQAETQLAELRRTTAQSENLLTVLVGGPLPGPLPAARPLSDPGQFAAIEPGLPSALLVNRPDVLQAEQRLRAANANIGVARASFLPNITLTGLLGFISPALGSLIGGDSLQYRVGANATQPILTWGKGRAGVALTRAQADELVAAYQKATQTAFREVADALVARRRYIEQIDAQTRAIDAQRRLVRVARLRYDNGLAIYLEVLDAERNLFAAEQQLLQLRSAQLQNDVSLYTALGGGLKEVSSG
ncbi:efflux transporter outer membrane subunit [Sphingomonas floccifaciens]|uniref:Efflux transporter outer membrane subunit n=1 Tax=Sphingomonas floccifaciens TaxID=1844115 RepID=A0ABW4NBE5_9SPHN